MKKILITRLFSLGLVFMAIGPLDAKADIPATQAAPQDIWLHQLPQPGTYKKVFILFTNPAWCHPCAYFEKNVVSKPAFAEGMKDYTLVKITIPNFSRTDLNDDEKAAVKLLNSFNAPGIPSMYVLDSNGKAYFSNLGGYSGDDPIRSLFSDLRDAEQHKQDSDALIVRAVTEKNAQSKVDLLLKALTLIQSKGVGIPYGYQSVVPYGYQSVAIDLIETSKISDPEDKQMIRRGFAKSDLERRILKSEYEKNPSLTIKLTEQLMKDYGDSGLGSLALTKEDKVHYLFEEAFAYHSADNYQKAIEVILRAKALHLNQDSEDFCDQLIEKEKDLLASQAKK